MSFASTIPGVCDACSHDVHTIVLLGAVLALECHEQLLTERDITVRVIVQSTEECRTCWRA